MHVFPIIYFVICCIILYLFNINVFVDCDIPSGPPPPPLLRPSLDQRNYIYNGQNQKSIKHEIKINRYHALQMFILIFGVFTLLWPCPLHLCTHVSYVTSNTNLNLYSKKKILLISTECIPTYLSLKVLGLLILSECEKEQIVLLISLINPIGNVIELLLQCNKTILRVISGTLPLYIFLFFNYACNLHPLPYNNSNMAPFVC